MVDYQHISVHDETMLNVAVFKKMMTHVDYFDVVGLNCTHCYMKIDTQ